MKPHEHVGFKRDPQTERWVLFRRAWLQVVLHRHRKSDAPVLHDHAWWNVSVVLRGRGREWRAYGEALGRRLFPGRVIFRRATDLHWLEIPKGGELWTLFITGPAVREWGYKRRDGRWASAKESPDVHDITRFKK